MASDKILSLGVDKVYCSVVHEKVLVLALDGFEASVLARESDFYGRSHPIEGYIGYT